jgi:hypothetical protein
MKREIKTVAELKLNDPAELEVFIEQASKRDCYFSNRTNVIADESQTLGASGV